MPLKIIIFLFLVFVSSNVSSNEVTPFVRASFFYNTEPIGYKAFIDDWDDHFWGGRKAIGLTSLELGTKLDRWQFTLFQRSVSYLKFHAETAEVLYLINNKLPLSPDRRYRVDLEVKHMLADGVKINREVLNTTKFGWNVGVALLSGRKILDGTLIGYVSAKTESDYDFDNINLDYYYSVDKIFNHEAKNPLGQGISLDTSFEWKPNEQFKANWFIGDLFAFIDWQAAPTTIAQLESDNKTFDENGYVKIDPILKGRQSEKDFRQYLPLYSNLSTETKLTQYTSLLLGIKYTYVKSFADIGVAFSHLNNLDIQTSYVLNVQAFSVAISNNYFNMRIALDDIDVSKTRFLEFSSSFFYRF